MGALIVILIVWLFAFGVSLSVEDDENDHL